MKTLNAQRPFVPLISLSGLLAIGLLSGCQPAPEPTPAATLAPETTLPACPSSSWCDDVSHLRPAVTVDYLELRSIGDGASSSGCVVAASGSACSGASDMAGCRRAVAALTPDWYWFGSQSRSLVITAGDEVRSAASEPSRLAAFLLPIDSEWEAVLAVRAAGYQADCVAPMAQVVSATPDGYQVIANTGTACGPGQDIYRHTLLVSADGTLSDQKQELLKKTDPNCIIE